NRYFPSGSKVPFLLICLPTSAKRSRVSIMIFRGESSLPVILAGQTDVQRPHSVQVYASSRLFQLRSMTSLEPNRSGSSVGGGGVKDGSSIAFTSVVTASILSNFPFGSNLEK